MLIPGFRSRGAIRVFGDGWSERVQSFTPAALAATLDQLEQLTGVGIPSLTHAIIVLGRENDRRLTDSGRERLWTAFRVPAFEQIIGEDQMLLARECEAHDGLHIESAKLTIAPQRIDHSECGCGRKTPRLIFEERPEVIRRLAAYAR